MSPTASIASTQTIAPTASISRKRTRLLVGEQLDPGQREHRDEVEQREARQRGEGAEQRSSAIPCEQRLERRRRLQLAVFEQALELGRGDEPQAREQRDDVDRERDEEGIAPAPA